MMSGQKGVVINASPRVCLHDVPTSIIISALNPNTPTTVTIITHNDEGKKFSSLAQFVSDNDGKIDVDRSESVGGSYTGVFPRGLFSTIREFPFKGNRLQKLDPTKPWKMTVSVYENHVTLEEVEGAACEAIACIELVRHVMGPGVRRVLVHDGRVRGALFIPQGPGPFPAVIDVFGGFGGLREYRAAIMASRGFACLALAYFKYDDLPKSMDNLDLGYFEEAVNYILSLHEVIPDRCAVLSSSKGSDTSLAMGIYLEKVKAVICIGGMLAKVGTTLTYKGEELWKGRSMMNHMTMDSKRRIVQKESSVREIYEADGDLIVPCEEAPEDTHFLLVAGDQDTTHAKYGVDAMAERMKKHGKNGQCHTIIYEGAGHIIEPPYNTSSDHSTYKMLPGYKGIGESLIPEMVIWWGGEARGTSHAQEENWKRIQEFMNLHVRDRSEWYQDYLERSLKV